MSPFTNAAEKRGKRLVKRDAELGSFGLGGSPSSRMRGLVRPGVGTADNKAWV